MGETLIEREGIILIESKDLQLSKIISDCKSIDELNRLATSFNRMHKKAWDSMNRVEELR